MNIREYIDSGILELYVLGAASEKEVREILYLKEHYPPIREALHELEIDMERIAERMAITPPHNTWNKIASDINNELMIPEFEPLKVKETYHHDPKSKRDQFINVEAESTHMRVHKSWKWILAAVFVLGKIFLVCAIYFYLENRQAQQQINDLKIELKQRHTVH